MSKSKSAYICQNCDYFSSKWLGKCPACGCWNSLEEMIQPNAPSREQTAQANVPTWFPLISDPQTQSDLTHRLSTGYREIDRVLGGGFIPDSFTLLGGDPGIGKSTLLLQMSQGLLKHHPEIKILYVSGEESIHQIRHRAERLAFKNEAKMFLATETHVEPTLQLIETLQPQILIVDSLQTFSTETRSTALGSIQQVKEIAAILMETAKSKKIAIFLVGHVTKDGSIAGPKTIEHMVDTVLYFEGDSGQNYRLLRTIKNRFGSTRELGVFEMTSEGLREVLNPSSLFLSDRTLPVPGTAVATSLEGSRPLLIEIQALVTSSGLAIPRRTASGIDTTRVALIAAILEKHLKLSLNQQDLFVNVVGGFRLSEPACDLATAAAILSSFEQQPVSLDCTFIGELGLTGEIRKASQIEVRLEEAKRLGFKTIIAPKSTPDKALQKFESHLKIIKISAIHDLKRILQNG